MAVAIAFFCLNAVEAIQFSCISMILNLNGFYSIYAKKCDSHSHLKCIRKHKISMLPDQKSAKMGQNRPFGVILAIFVLKKVNLRVKI